jgi:SAM-dependent methyltransferase
MSANATPAFQNPAATWNSRFASEGFLFGTEPNEWLRNHAHVWKAPSRILCVADGEGRNSVWLARQGHTVDAFDVSDVGVAKAKRLASDHAVNVNFAVADCDSFHWQEARYDGVAAIFVQFADPALRERLFALIARCLKPGGTLILQGYTPKQLEYKTGGPPVLSHLYTPELLQQSFAEMDIQVLQAYEQDLAEGSGHRGKSALIGLVASRRPV